MKDSVISVPCPLPPLKRELHAGVGREPPYSSPRPPTFLSQACTQRELGHIIESPSACCQLLVPGVLHPLFSLCHLASPPSLSAWFKIDRRRNVTQLLSCDRPACNPRESPELSPQGRGIAPPAQPSFSPGTKTNISSPEKPSQGSSS